MNIKKLLLLIITFVFVNKLLACKQMYSITNAVSSSVFFLHPSDTLILKWADPSFNYKRVILCKKDSLVPLCPNYDGVNPALLGAYESPFFNTNFTEQFYKVVVIDSVTSMIIPTGLPPTCTNVKFTLRWSAAPTPGSCGGVQMLTGLSPTNLNTALYNYQQYTPNTYSLTDTVRFNQLALSSDDIQFIIDWGDGSMIDTITGPINSFGTLNFNPTGYYLIFSGLFNNALLHVYPAIPLYTGSMPPPPAYIANLSVSYMYSRCANWGPLPNYVPFFDNCGLSNKNYFINNTTYAMSINEIENKLSSLKVYPNPFSSKAYLQTNITLQSATLSIYNTFGQEVKQLKNISGQLVQLNNDDLPSGVYFIRLIENNKTIATEKIIITD